MKMSLENLKELDFDYFKETDYRKMVDIFEKHLEASYNDSVNHNDMTDEVNDSQSIDEKGLYFVDVSDKENMEAKDDNSFPKQDKLAKVIPTQIRDVIKINKFKIVNSDKLIVKLAIMIK